MRPCELSVGTIISVSNISTKETRGLIGNPIRCMLKYIHHIWGAGGCFMDLEYRLKQALNEIQQLKEENHQLKIRLSEFFGAEAVVDNTSNVDISVPTGAVHKHSSPAEKISVFMNLFRGREDVYPIRWASKSGKSGYSPACQNEWTAICKKPQVKCRECAHQAYFKFDEQAVAQHLDAKINRTIGIYPMLQDETCWFLAMDFDKQDWQPDALAVMNTCRDHGIPSALERSRSGNGGHIWFFFDQPVEASLARSLGSAILTKTMESRYQVPLDSYDRLFPNQDTLPKGGFGNLIALPLQGIPRKNGNSIFLDEQLQPYSDQWAFLSSLRKISVSEIQSVIREFTKGTSLLSVSSWDTTEEDRPWLISSTPIHDLTPGSLPASVHVVVANMLFVEKAQLPSLMINRIRSLAAFQNPDFYKTQAMRLPTFGKPRVINCSEDYTKYIAIPRGCLKPLTDYLESMDIRMELSDERNSGVPLDIVFQGTLSMLQDGAARSMLKHDIGILSASTAFGKTVVAASIIASRKVNTLILVHRRELMEQWKERLQTFLSLDKKDIGIIGGGKEKRSGKIDIAVIQSLNHKGIVKDYIQEYGHIIVDECHHISAFSFEQVLKKSTAKYMLGLTATPTRQDGHQPIVLMQCGPIRVKIDAKSQAIARGMEHRVIPRYTNFKLPSGETNLGIQDIYQQLVLDEQRNTMIFDDLLKSLEEGRSPILLAERTAHVEYFEKRLEGFAKNVIVLRGGMGKKQRETLREQIQSIPDHEERVFIATGKLVGEGFDDSRLDSLFLVHPISWRGTLQQYVGRLHRTHQNKKEVRVYDYVDIQVPMLMSMYKKRIKGYKTMGYSGMSV
jgi:superfamily II DNA or RNA helicase